MRENETTDARQPTRPPLVPKTPEPQAPAPAPPVDLEACPLCSSKERSHYYVRGRLKLAKCSQCSMIWDDQAPTQPTALYTEDYYQGGIGKGGYTNYFSDMSLNRRTFADRLKRAYRRQQFHGQLLDIGCALGDCLLEAKRMGWKDPKGLEVSKFAKEIAESRGLTIFHGDLRKSTLPPTAQFDLILLQDVIEHTVDPVFQAQAVYRRLRPGGLALFITPNVAGKTSRWMRGAWYHYKKDEHLTYFSPKTMRALLQKAGFEPIEIGPTRHHLTLGYIVDRLKNYAPWLFVPIGRLLKSLRLSQVSIWIRTGELEAWGTRPLHSRPTLPQ